MQVLYERCAAVDVGKDMIAVAVRLPGDGPDGRQTVKRKFKTFYGVLREAARWLVSEGVTHVAMEATGIYSMPVYHALLEHGDFEKVLVCNARHVKNVPRPQDLADAEWLMQLLECGLLAGSFIPRPTSRPPGTSSATAPRLSRRRPRRSSGSATCSRTPASRSTRWPPLSWPRTI
jgi:transposase